MALCLRGTTLKILLCCQDKKFRCCYANSLMFFSMVFNFLFAFFEFVLKMVVNDAIVIVIQVVKNGYTLLDNAFQSLMIIV